MKALLEILQSLDLSVDILRFLDFMHPATSEFRKVNPSLKLRAAWIVAFNI